MTARTRRPAVLPAPAAAPAAGLGSGVPLIAAVGLLTLCFCTLPAVLQHRALIAEHARQVDAVRQVEARLARVRRTAEAARTNRFLRKKAASRLVHDGRAYLARRDAALAAAGLPVPRRP